MPCLLARPARFLCIAVCAAAVAPTAAAAPTPTAVIASLNQMRMQNGIPGGIVENPMWSQRCAQHNAYELENDTLAHVEDPSRPGYSPGGRWAGENSVLALGSQPVQVFTTAPLHMVQLMSPQLRRVGVATTGSYTCITTWPGYDLKQYRGKRERVYTYPGNRAAGVSPRETANELPFTPGQFVGIPAGTPTGPVLFAYAVGSWNEWTVSVAAVKLSGPSGAVATKSVDRLTPDVGDYLPPGAAVVIPVVPLSPQEQYTATITLRDAAGHTVTHTWSFTTAS
jgi:hypothetical protein